MKKLILHRITQHSTVNSPLRQEQFGFRNITPIYSSYGVTERYILAGFTAAVFLDMEKAFDKIWHVGLI